MIGALILTLILLAIGFLFFIAWDGYPQWAWNTFLALAFSLLITSVVLLLDLFNELDPPWDFNDYWLFGGEMSLVMIFIITITFIGSFAYNFHRLVLKEWHRFERSDQRPMGYFLFGCLGIIAALTITII